MKILKELCYTNLTNPNKCLKKKLKLQGIFFDTNNIEYSEIETIDKRYGFGISFYHRKEKKIIFFSILTLLYHDDIIKS